MPTYRFHDKANNCYFEKFMKISEFDDYLKENPDYECVPYTPVAIVSGVSIGNSMKPSENFRDILRHIKKNNPRSNINTF